MPCTTALGRGDPSRRPAAADPRAACRGMSVARLSYPARTMRPSRRLTIIGPLPRVHGMQDDLHGEGQAYGRSAERKRVPHPLGT